MKKAFLLLCTLLLVLGSLLPLAGYRLAKAVLGEAAASSEVPASSALPAPGGSLPGTDTGSPETVAFTGDAEVFLIEDQSTGEVQQVPRRDYLIGAVAAEMPLSWPDEALKAQAVAAHSYVLYCRDHATAANGAWLSADPARRQGYLPDAVQEEGADHIVPAEPMDIRLMSIGFFIKPTDALLWRGAMAVSALKQMIHQTKWGTLDFLLADLPPGTGDVHLSIIGELKIDSAVIVSTPQQVALADVVRGVEMFCNENVNIPVAGIIENMAWFTPEELPENRYYLFGKGGARRFAEEKGVDFLGEIPIVQSIMEGSDEGKPAMGIDPRVEKWYRGIAEKIVEKVMKSC